MANVYPGSPKFETRGEERAFNYLNQQLQDSWHIFYEPLIDDVKPDIVIFSPYYGALIIEVKDYSVQTIVNMAPDYWEIVVDGETKSVTSPYAQSRAYMYKLADLLEKQNEFRWDSGVHKGKLFFPVMCACWFVNITAHDANYIGINKLVPTKALLTKDEFGKSGIEQSIIGLLVSRFTPRELSIKQTNAFVKLLNPTHTIPGYKDIRRSWFRTFQSNIQKFPNLVDEVLFVATEVRHLCAKGATVDNIVLYVLTNRRLKNHSVAEFAERILMDMGIRGIQVRVLADDIHIINEKRYVFVMDIHLEGMNEQKEASLSQLREASIEAWFTSSCLE